MANPTKSSEVSLLKSIRSTVLSFSVSLITIGLASVIFVSYTLHVNERKSALKIIGSTLSKLVARPASLGDFVLVESYLRSAEETPEYVEKVELINGDGEIMAASQVRKSSCSSIKTDLFPIKGFSEGSIEVLGAHQKLFLRFTTSNCDVWQRLTRISIVVVVVSLIMFVFLSLMVRKSVKNTLIPLKQSVELNTNQIGVSDSIEATAPVEIRPLIAKIKILYNQNIEHASKVKIAEVTRQVAHDIRAPLAALNVLKRNISELPIEKKQLLQDAIKRISDIADDLLKKNKGVRAGSAEHPRTDNIVVPSDSVLQSLESLVQEKKLLIDADRLIKLQIETHGDFGANCLVRAVPSEVQRIVSNLINNSLDALVGSSRGSIKVLVEANKSCFVIKVTDDGPGIPEHVLKKLGKQEYSYNKHDRESSGFGLGLFHAFQTVESWGGQIGISSAVGVGTEVTLQLPVVT